MLFRDNLYILTEYGFKRADFLELEEDFEIAYLKDNKINYTKDFEFVNSTPKTYYKISSTKFTNLIFTEDTDFFGSNTINFAESLQNNNKLGITKSGNFTDDGKNESSLTFNYIKNNLKLNINLKLSDLLTILILFDRFGSISKEYVVLRIYNNDIFKDTVSLFKKISNYNNKTDLLPYISWKDNFISISSSEFKRIFSCKEMFIQKIFKDLNKKTIFEEMLTSFLFMKDAMFDIYSIVDVNLEIAQFISALAFFNGYKSRIRYIRNQTKLCVNILKGDRETIKLSQMTSGENHNKNTFIGIELKEELGNIIVAQRVGNYMGISIIKSIPHHKPISIESVFEEEKKDDEYQVNLSKNDILTLDDLKDIE